jgi:DGQHR domain-containing protein
MKKNSASITIEGLIGKCGHLDVFLGFASAELLCEISAPDTLNDGTGLGYQRPYNRPHSLDFKRYITQEGSSTIPLVFNLRKDFEGQWQLKRGKGNRAHLILKKGAKSLIIVDGQHRLGELADVSLFFSFMAFIGLDLRTETSLFSVINSKAKGLPSSLTDFLQSKLVNDITQEAPHLYLAKRLNEDPDSPWYRLIRYGGETTSGLKRRTSLRMMQKCIDRLLKRLRNKKSSLTIDDYYNIIHSYWDAVKETFPDEWKDHRHHLLTKGIGLYSLMLLLGEIISKESFEKLTQRYFVSRLQPLKTEIDWNTKGIFAGAGGQKGAVEVYEKLRKVLAI